MEKSPNLLNIPKLRETNLRNILDKQTLEEALAELAEKGSAFVHLNQEHHIPRDQHTTSDEPLYFQDVYDEKTGKKYVLRTEPKIHNGMQLAKLEERQ